MKIILKWQRNGLRNYSSQFLRRFVRYALTKEGKYRQKHLKIFIDIKREIQTNIFRL